MENNNKLKPGEFFDLDVAINYYKATLSICKEEDKINRISQLYKWLEELSKLKEFNRDSKWQTCPKCHGNRSCWKKYERTNSTISESYNTCPVCNGFGVIDIDKGIPPKGVYDPLDKKLEELIYDVDLKNNRTINIPD
jgi:hypothetical protein